MWYIDLNKVMLFLFGLFVGVLIPFGSSMIFAKSEFTAQKSPAKVDYYGNFVEKIGFYYVEINSIPCIFYNHNSSAISCDWQKRKAEK